MPQQTNPSFFLRSIPKPTLSPTMARKFSSTSSKSTATGHDTILQGSTGWHITLPPMPELRILTQCDMQQGKVKHRKELQWHIRVLKAERMATNKSHINKIHKYGQRGKNILWKTSKQAMTSQDQINQGAVAAYPQELVWPATNMLPKNWTKLREDWSSLCQMILRKLLYELMENYTGIWAI